MTTMTKKIITVWLLTFMAVGVYAAKKEYEATSPDGKLQVHVLLKDKIYYAMSYDGVPVMSPSPISMVLEDGTELGKNPIAKKGNTTQKDQLLHPLYGKRTQIHDRYSELTITFRGNYSLTLRLYDEGFAYRFNTSLGEQILVKDEEATFNFTGDYQLWAAKSISNSFEHSYENFYNQRPLSQAPDSLMMLPVLVQTDKHLSVLITEANLEDYPGFHVVNNSASATGLKAAFPRLPVKWKPGGHMNFNLKVQQRAGYIAKTTGKRHFPWRVMKIATTDAQLLDTDLVYKLSDPADPDDDFSWVKPGKVAWDWWCAMNLTGVDFRAGINTTTYKYYIDFAAEHGIDYINLDEGWSDQYDIMKLTDQINLKEIIDYGKQKGVGVFLWCVHYALDQKLQEAMDQFEAMGVKGLKIDFMDRDDQLMVNFYHRIAKSAAAHKLLVNFHGAYKPAGLRRKYPNLINRESVRGLEYNKFSKPYGTTPEHAVTIPFIRMAAGPLDYTPGAMNNAQKANFGVFFERPMSQGTRCQQLALFVVYEAPLEMLSDAPTAYEKDPVILHYLSEVPTVWDETKALDGKVGDYAVIARRAGDTWYIAGMTDWSPRDIQVDLSFLAEGTYQMELFKDGINADRNGTDYSHEMTEIKNPADQQIHLAPGGGFVLKLKKQ